MGVRATGPGRKRDDERDDRQSERSRPPPISGGQWAPADRPAPCASPDGSREHGGRGRHGQDRQGAMAGTPRSVAASSRAACVRPVMSLATMLRRWLFHCELGEDQPTRNLLLARRAATSASITSSRSGSLSPTSTGEDHQAGGAKGTHATLPAYRRAVEPKQTRLTRARVSSNSSPDRYAIMSPTAQAAASRRVSCSARKGSRFHCHRAGCP